IRHVGYENLTAILRRAVATFGNADRVWLVGESSGGFGAMWNMDHVQKAFTHARVDVVDDSGPPIAFPADRYQAWVTSWKMQFPEGCTDCPTKAQAILDYNSRTYPDHRVALLSYSNDLVIPEFAGIGLGDFTADLGALKGQFNALKGFRYFV